jgi:hypothetical protein
MSLQGTLSHFGVADIFQLIAQQRQTGVLRISNDRRELDISFFEGSVMRAHPSESRPDGALASFLLRAGALSEPDLAAAWREQEETLESLVDVLLSNELVPKDDLEQCARLLTDETIFELFLWDDGRFEFEPGELVQGRFDVLVGAEMVLLDALRMRDEWPGVQAGLPDLSKVLAPAVDIRTFEVRRAGLESSSGASADALERLYLLANDRLAARRMIDLSRLGTFDGARGLVTLLRADVLRFETPSERADAADAAAAPIAWLQPAWLALMACVAVTLLIWPAPEPQSHPVPTLGLRAAQEESGLLRLRAALEAHRWATGAYPKSLAELRDRRETGLAPLPVGRYSYTRSGAEYELESR